jgi:hypothetical protein
MLPYVRPLGAVHLTAGNNALRGSGSGPQPAFDDAMARVGCTVRRIDRLCKTCCSPSQPLYHAGKPARSRRGASVRRCRGDAARFNSEAESHSRKVRSTPDERTSSDRADCPFRARNGSRQTAYSITSSARASNVDGTSRLSNFAVLTLKTSRKMVGCSTGRSAGFAPRSILST